jgi:Asp-tRNA(Asn)/Glu-tRNA(Gln) amidotransferase A subunit family amidase
MSITRREAIARLTALVALPAARWQLPRTAGDPLDGTIRELQDGRVRGDWTFEEITRRALERCTSQGQRLRAIDTLTADRAIVTARNADARAKRAVLPFLSGVPVFAKAIYDVEGTATTGSSAEWARLFPEIVYRDSREVESLRGVGAIILGKTAADDFAYRGNGTSSHTGQVLNPHDPTGVRTPGGSSAGSAVAVATGMAFAAFGTDDGGSNRIPAQFTGIVGMKPTFGLVPRTGVIPTWPYLDTHGPLARHVDDAAILLASMVTRDDRDPLSLMRPTPDGLMTLDGKALIGARLGIVDAHVPRAQMTVEARAMWDRAVSDLRTAGAIVDTFDAAVTRVNYRDLFAEAAKARSDVPVNANSPAPTANALYEYFRGRATSDREAREAIKRGYAAYRAFYNVLPATYEECEPLLAQPMANDPAGLSFARSRGEVVALLASSMSKANLTAMVYPTMPFNAPRAVDPWPDVRTPLGFGNWLGLPEVSVPAGVGADGMPAMNISFVGLPGHDAEVLALAHAYELAWNRRVAPKLG